MLGTAFDPFIKRQATVFTSSCVADGHAWAAAGDIPGARGGYSQGGALPADANLTLPTLGRSGSTRTNAFTIGTTRCA